MYLASIFSVFRGRGRTKPLGAAQASKVHRLPFRADEWLVCFAPWAFLTGSVGKEDTVSRLNGPDSTTDCIEGLELDSARRSPCRTFDNLSGTLVAENRRIG